MKKVFLVQKTKEVRFKKKRLYYNECMRIGKTSVLLEKVEVFWYIQKNE